VFLSARPSDERCLLWGLRSHIHPNSHKDKTGVSDGGYFEVKRPAVSAQKYPKAQKNKKDTPRNRYENVGQIVKSIVKTSRSTLV